MQSDFVRDFDEGTTFQFQLTELFPADKKNKAKRTYAPWDDKQRSPCLICNNLERGHESQAVCQEYFPLRDSPLRDSPRCHLPPVSLVWKVSHGYGRAVRGRGPQAPACAS